jgi:hypothetical protein
MPAANSPLVSTTSAELVAKFAEGVVDTSDIAAGVVDTSSAPGLATVIFRKI